MSRLRGKTLIATGAARGQGAAEAEALPREGAVVIATDVTPGCRFDANANITPEQVSTLADSSWVTAGQPLRLIGDSGRRT